MSPISKYTKYHNFQIKARLTKEFSEGCKHKLSGIFIRSQFRVLFQFKDMEYPPKTSFGHSGVKIRKNHLMPIYTILILSKF